MNRYNFMDCMAPNAVSGQDLQPTEQAAMAIKMRRNAECREREKSGAGYGGPMLSAPGDFSQWEREHRLLGRVDKRMQRGGMTMRPEDAITNMQRRTIDDL